MVQLFDLNETMNEFFLCFFVVFSKTKEDIGLNFCQASQNDEDN